MHDILKANYIECCKVIQRSYLVVYVAAVAFLGVVLQVQDHGSSQQFSIPVLNINLGSAPVALLLTFGVYVGATVIVWFASVKRHHIQRGLPKDELDALETFPSLATGGLILRITATAIPIAVLTVALRQGKSPVDWHFALLSAAFVSYFLIASLVPPRSKQNATAAKVASSGSRRTAHLAAKPERAGKA